LKHFEYLTNSEFKNQKVKIENQKSKIKRSQKFKIKNEKSKFEN